MIVIETGNAIVIETLIVIEIRNVIVIETLIVIGNDEDVQDHETGIVKGGDRNHLVTANHQVAVINIRKANARNETNLIVKLKKKSKKNQKTTLNNY